MGFYCEQLNPHACKTYLLGISERPEVIFIDPVIEHVSDYIALINKRGLKPTTIIDTHTHADHISGSASLKDMSGCDYVMHVSSPVQCANFRVHDGFSWDILENIPATVRFTPGHTKDSICIICNGILFSGDTLFLDDGGAGRDDLPGGDPGQHWESLQVILSLPEELMVYPAHDYRSRTPSNLKQQKKTNPHLKPRSKQEFVNYLEELKLGPADWMKDVLKANYACAQSPNAAWIPTDSPACEVKGTMTLGANEVAVGSIPPSVLAQKLRSKQPPVLLDVREKNELSGPLGALEGIVHIPISQLSHRIDELNRHKDREIITVCKSGGRAHTAAQILTAAGFRSVTVLAGGMIAWRGQ
ncbi:MAG: MBL fold metallo-hydrolase [Chitinivibrionales bacterium]|nr:MBL fold metallo-hydrolase [Chitinivibrionales bacterium]